MHILKVMKDSRPARPVSATRLSDTVHLDPPSAAAPMLTALAGRYDLMTAIGAGGMGRVYKARDRETNEVVALKVLRPDVAADPAMAERFKNELRLARRITHKNVCRIYEFHRLDEIAYITMEYVDGESLRARLRHSAPLPVAAALEIIAQICAGLREAHAQGVVHRDLKPENIMIARAGEVKIMDFGIARSVESPATATVSFLGTPAYMAPEQASGKPVDQRADIYALGLVFYECLTGHRAFSGDTPIEVALKQVNERPRPPRQIAANIPVALEAVILRCLEKDPARRFASADEVEHAFRRSTAAVARTPVVKEQSAPPHRRGRAAVWLGALILTAGGAVTWHNSKSPIAPTAKRVETALAVVPTTPLPVPAENRAPTAQAVAPRAAPDAIDANAAATGTREPGADFDKLVAAAEAGRPQAQYRLAQMLAIGPAGVRDESKAVEWMRRAAEQGHTGAQFGLGKMYDKGRGVARDPASARSWYERAAAGGHEEARNLLRRSPERSGSRR